jgi:hypothetical protein
MNEAEANPGPKARKPSRIVLRGAIGFVAGVVLLAWAFGAFRREPMHKGKPISYWVDQACINMDGTETWQRRMEVKEIGEAAVPYLVKRLRATDWGRATWNSLRTHFPQSWQDRFPERHSAQEIHYGAARTLGLFGSAAKPAVPELIRLLPEITDPALEALAVIGTNATEALPALHGMVTNGNANQRVAVARAIWFIGRETNTVLDVCTKVMLSGAECGNAPGLLIELKTAAAPAVPAALMALQDTNHSVGMRANSAIVLGTARVDSPEIRAALLDGAMEGRETNFRLNCLLGLWGLDAKYAAPATRMMMEEFVNQRKFTSGGGDRNFLLWLEMRGLDPRESVPTLKELLQSDSADLRKEAALTLEQISAKFGPVK